MRTKPWLTIVLAGAAATAALAPADRPSTTRLALSGLELPVEVLRDRFGVSHIYAGSEHDLFFSQGYCAARDRLFQLELWRRQATGRMAEIQGPAAVERDAAARLLQFRGDVKRELELIHPRGAAIVSAFVDGINARIDEAVASGQLPVEFRMLGIVPGRFTPEVVLSRHNLLSQNAARELEVARLVGALGAEGARALLDLRPGTPELRADPAIDLGALEPAILRPLTLFHAPVRFGGSDDAPGEPGSNNWAVSPARTFRGSALFASDPHRAIQVPSLRYFVHLVGPGWNVIGAGEPAVPGVALGHNEHGAWGLTVFRADQEDLYVYDTDPADPSRYLYSGRYEAMREVRESIAVKGGAAVPVTLRFTRHGPVLHQDTARRKAYALRAAWLEPGAAPYLASLRLAQARSWDEFRQASASYFAPAENLIWADRSGTIGFQAAGLAPERPSWNGLLPVPGDGRYEWAGFRKVAELPSETNPARGFLATANNDTQPPGFPRPVGFQWTAPNRYGRIVEVLSSDRLLTLADMVRLQQDDDCVPARALVPLLRGLEPSAERTREARDLLLRWDLRLDRDSVAAAVYVFWEKALLKNARARLVPEPARAILSELRVERLIEWLASPDGRFGEDPLAGRNAFLLDALEDAVSALRERAGPASAGWRYGQPRLKHALLRHPLGAIADAGTRARLDVGPAARSGNSRTVNSTGDDLNQSDGASARMVADVGDWDLALATNTPGQSGDPASPHYSDLFEPWARGEYFPLFYSRDKVLSVAEERLLLEPSGSRPADVAALDAKAAGAGGKGAKGAGPDAKGGLLIAADSFEYPAGRALSGLNGGSGWKDAWFTSSLNTSDSGVEAAGMQFPGLAVAGGSSRSTGNEVRTFRRLDLSRRELQPFVDEGRLGKDGTTIWIAFLTALSATPGNSAQGYGSIHLNDGVGDLSQDQYGDKRNHQRVQIGDRNSAEVYYIGRVTNGAPGSSGYDTSIPFDTRVRLVAVRFDFRPGDETFWMFVDPPPGREPAESTAIVTGTMSDFRFDIVQVGSGGSRFPNELVDTDELRIATTFEKAVPASRGGSR